MRVILTVSTEQQLCMDGVSAHFSFYDSTFWDRGRATDGVQLEEEEARVRRSCGLARWATRVVFLSVYVVACSVRARYRHRWVGGS